MPAPPNWPVDRLVTAEEGMRLSAEHTGKRLGSPDYSLKGPVHIYTATGKYLRNVLSCCVTTGEVHQLSRIVESTKFYPAPLTVTYEPLTPT